MNYKIASKDGTTQLVNIASAYFKAWQVWNVQFANGNRFMLFKMGSEWMQRKEDFLDLYVLDTLGKCIDKIILRRKSFSI